MKDINIIEFLTYLRSLKINLSLKGDRLICQAPHGVINRELQARIKERKPEIIATLKQYQTAPFFEITPVSREREIPLSFAQERLWFIDRFEGASAVYNIPKIVKLRGELNIRALEKAISYLLQRHESLRSNFENRSGKPVLKIAPQLDFVLPIVNLENLSPTEREKTIQKLIKQEIATTFNLESDRLVKFTLLKLTPQSHILIIIIHHIIADGWSMGILTQEFSHLYQAYNQNTTPNLAPLPIQYSDFAVWQRDYFQENILNSQINYWQNALDGIPQFLSLPLDKPRPKIQTFNGAVKTFTISSSLTQQLKLFAQQNNVTLYITLLSVFAILLSRYSNQTKLIIGSPIANRNHQEIENLIGFFVNSLPLGIRLDRNSTFTELVQQVKTTALEAYEHQDLPFEKLVQELKVERNLSYNPLFQVLFALQNIPDNTFKLDNLEVESIPCETKTAKFDLGLFIKETPENIKCIWEYKTDLFNLDTIERITGHFQNLIAEILQNSQQKISLLSLLTAEEKRQLLQEQNHHRINYANYPPEKCLHQLFEIQAATTPDAIAVVLEEQQLTYQQLNQQANQLAHYLQQLGVEPETKVGICLHRSLDMIIGLLGILKAGGAYIPLDPNSPPERLNFILQDANIDILLTQESILKQIPSDTQIPHLLCLDRQDLFTNQPTSNTISQTQPHNLSYIIYTSGSTGKPKGVEITHHNVVSLFQATKSYYQFSPRDRWTLFHSFAFDFAVWEIWGALIYGGTLVIVPYLVSRSPEQFYNLLQQQKITVLNQTPSAFTQLTSFLSQQKEQDTLDNTVRLRKVVGLSKQGEQGSFGCRGSRNYSYPNSIDTLDDLRWIIFGGEKLNFASLKPWYESQRKNNSQLVNMYGITEITVHATYQPVSEALTDSQQSLIGKALPDLKIYILDRELNLVPKGIPGELHIAGEGLARGYLNRPELTAARFIDNPFREGKLYKTGDLARYLADGNIEFLGRIDNQVKIRGFRIELGEIEAILREHSTVREAVVTVKEDSTEDRRLIAYVIPHFNEPLNNEPLNNEPLNNEPLNNEPLNNEPLNQKELRNFLLPKLPEYMIPSAFVSLEAFPLTANGKIDLSSLPVPDAIRDLQEVDFVAPRDELERQLIQIWENILGIKSISIHDNFFEIGGHSLLTVRLVAEIEKTLNQKLPIAALFQLTSVEQVASVLRQNQVETTTKSVAQTSSQELLRLEKTEPFPSVGQVGRQKPAKISSSSIPELPIEDYRALLTTHAHWKSPRLGTKSLVLKTQAGNPMTKIPILAVGGMGDMHHHLASDRPVYSLPVHTHIRAYKIYVQALAACYVEEILTIQPEGPYVLFGYCFGGTVALEIAQQLQARGKEIAFLFLVERPSFNFLYNKYYLKMVRPFVVHWRQISKRNFPDQKAYIFQKTKHFIDKTFPQLKSRIKPSVSSAKNSKISSPDRDKSPIPERDRGTNPHSILLAQKHYQVQPYRGRVALYFSYEGARTSWLYPRGGWGKLIQGEVEVDTIMGETDTLLVEPNVKILAEKLEACLGKIESQDSQG